jgi:hypothetical protein
MVQFINKITDVNFALNGGLPEMIETISNRDRGAMPER